MKNQLWGRALFIATACMSSSAHAQDESSSQDYRETRDPRPLMQIGRPFYVSPMLSYTFADSARQTDDGLGGTLAIGTRVYEFLAVEAAANYVELDGKSEFDGSTAKITSYGANALFFPLKVVFPKAYVLFGLHYADSQDQPVGSGATAQLASFHGGAFDQGVGLLQPFNLFGFPAAARLQAVYRIDFHERQDSNYGNQHLDEVIVSAGIAVSLFDGGSR